ncbi:kinesin light chain 1 [Fusarium austroafricanum]|uniref:Kinesin light chain 1 n=1 Tax=Fusarium austroafricanum TaxID=2364996 RepID=A0A8H4KJR7_9HYPO|nr:kinesin light chain 1 [Fusarium austroafricanum]
MATISNSHFGDHAIIHQGNVHGNVYYGTSPHKPAPARAEVVRVIPYPRNEDIVHRKNLIDRLDELLPQTSGYRSAALCGLGGSGKTQIALDYVYRRCDADDKCCVFWVHADSQATFSTDYKTIGKNLGVDVERLDGLDLLDAVRSAIEGQSSRWVIVIDNADDLRLFGVGQKLKDKEANGNLCEYIPQGSQGTILWTTRDAHIAGTLVGTCRSIEVQSMAIGEATVLLTRATGEISGMGEFENQKEGLNALLEELQCLPLAISQAGAFMRRTLMTAKQYLSLLSQGKTRLEVLGVSDTDRYRRPEVSNSVLETWRISAERIRVESEMSYRILNVLAYVDNQDIPQELLVAAADEWDDDKEDHRDDQTLSCATLIDLKSDKGSQKQDDRDDQDSAIQISELEVLRAIARLKEFSFISLRQTADGKRSYEMHKLVQEALQYGLSMSSLNDGPRKMEELYSRRALQVVDDLFPIQNMDIQEESFVQPDSDTHVQCQRYLVHATRIAAWAEISGTEVQTANLLQRVSDFLLWHARWREKELIDSQAWDLRRKVLGEKHPDTIKSMASLARTHNGLGRFSTDMPTQVLELRKEVLGEKHPATMLGMSNLATAYVALGQYREAEEMHQQVLELRREVLGERHPDTMCSMQDLMMARMFQGQYSEKTAIQVLKMRQEVLGERHIHTIWSKSDLAAVYRWQGQYSKAESIGQEALELRKQLIGETHPETLRGLSELALTYSFQGQNNMAEKLKRQVLEQQREMLGEKHLFTIRSMEDLSSILYTLNRHKEAMDISVKVFTLRQEILGEKHPDTIRSLSHFARGCYRKGEFSKAKDTFQEVLKHQQQTLGERHLLTLEVMFELALVYASQGNYSKAEGALEDVLKVQQDELGKRHVNTLRSMSSLAAVYAVQGHNIKAQEIYEKVVELQQEELGERHPDSLGSMSNLAAVYAVQGHNIKAQEIYEKVVELQQEELGERRPGSFGSMSGLAAAHALQGHHSKAQDIYTELLKLQQEELGEKSPDTIASMALLAGAYHAQGQYKKAEKLRCEALELVREVLGEKHPETLRVMADLAITYIWLKHSKAEAACREVLKLRQEVLGGKHRDTIASLATLGTMYCHQEQYDKAEPLYQTALDLCIQVLGDDHVDAIRYRKCLASAQRSKVIMSEDPLVHPPWTVWSRKIKRHYNARLAQKQKP